MKQTLVLCGLLACLCANAMGPPIPPIPPPPPKCDACSVLRCDASRRCTCEPKPPTWIKTQVQPAYYITHVVYAVPGRSSSMQYQHGDTIGSTTNASKGFKEGASLTVSASGFLGVGGGTKFSTGADWGNTTTDSTDVSVGFTAAYRKPGEADSIQHDDDEIWFLVKPSIDLTMIEKTSCWTKTYAKWGFSPASYTTFYLTVGELAGRQELPDGVEEALSAWGISRARDFPEMLKAVPFPDGVAPDTVLDPARFEFVRSFPYKAVSAPNYQPTSQTWNLQRKTVNSTTKSKDVTYKTALSITGGVDLLKIVKFSTGLDQSWMWTESSSLKISVDDNGSNNITVGQPAYGYKGPAVLRVYEDKIWKTFFFQLDTH